MPTRDEIIAGLASVANEYGTIAITWHIIIFLIIVALFAGWKPGNSLMILLLSSLLMSVSVIAVISGNIFNAAVFAFLVVLSIYATLRSGNSTIRGDRSWPGIAGLALIIFGLVYPEFLQTISLLEFAYAAPTGVIPCPTLCVLTGFALLYKGFSSVTWSVAIAVTGLFYGLFGAIYLGVYADWFLVAGAVLLMINTFLLSKTVALQR